MSVLLRMVDVNTNVPTMVGHSIAAVMLAIALNQMERDAEFQVCRCTLHTASFVTDQQDFMQLPYARNELLLVGAKKLAHITSAQ